MKKATFVTILAALMIASSLTFTGCGQSGSDETKGTETTPSEALSTDTEKEEETVQGRENTPDTLPADLDFGGEDICILHRAGDHDVQVEITAENTGDVVDSSIFNRNISVEDRLNVKLKYEATTDEVHAGTLVNDLVKATVTAGDPVYDLVANHMSQTTPLVLNQHFLNLNAQPYLDFEMPWWNPSFREQITLNGKNYMAAGDISQTMLRGTYVTILNKSVLNEYHTGYDPYETVRAGGWTYDEVLRLADIYHDVNGDGKADVSDIYGFIRDAVGIVNDALVGSFDIPLVENEGDTLKIVFNSEKTVGFIEKAQVLFYENNYAIKQEYVDLANKLMDDTALMTIFRLSLTDSLRDMEADYMILPCPKYDEAQQNYCGFTHNGFSVFCIPVTCATPDITAATLEALCAESYRTCTLAYYETTIKGKLARDTDTAEMLDLIHEGVRFDFGYVYSASLADLIQIPRNYINNGKTSNGASTLAKKVALSEAKLPALLEAGSGLSKSFFCLCCCRLKRCHLPDQTLLFPKSGIFLQFCPPGLLINCFQLFQKHFILLRRCLMRFLFL